jgi:hypothetical protein
MSKDKVLEKDDLLAFICESNKDCIDEVNYRLENLKVSRHEITFDLYTVIEAYGRSYKVNRRPQHLSWSRRKGNTLTLTTPCPFNPLTIR